MIIVVLRPLGLIDSFLEIFSEKYEVFLGDLAPLLVEEVKETVKEQHLETFLEEIVNFCKGNQEHNRFVRDLYWVNKRLKLRRGDIIQLDNRVSEITRQGIEELDKEPLIHVAHTILPPDANEAEAREDFQTLSHEWVQDEVLETVQLGWHYIETCIKAGSHYHRLRTFK